MSKAGSNTASVQYNAEPSDMTNAHQDAESFLIFTKNGDFMQGFVIIMYASYASSLFS